MSGRPHESPAGGAHGSSLEALRQRAEAKVAEVVRSHPQDSNSSDLQRLMHELNVTGGVTFLFSTHDRQIMRKARRVLAMHDGEVREEHTRAAEHEDADEALLATRSA